MREIKFRAWDVFYKKFTYSHDCGSDAIDNRLASFFGIVEGARASKRDVPVMQFTGLKDKNGEEIYEGDIIGEAGCAYKVEFKDGIFCIGGATEPAIYWIWARSRKGIVTEVIGNIYENPELLNA